MLPRGHYLFPELDSVSRGFLTKSEKVTAEWIELLVLCLVMQPVIWYWAGWLKRRKLPEREEVKRILDGMKE